jgi:glycosidase
MDDIIELDFTNASMRQAMMDAMKFWVTNCDIDGFRCDLAFWVQLDFWMEAIPKVSELKALFWLAEMDPIEHPDYMQVFDAAYAWEWMHKTEEWYKKSLPLKDIVRVLTRYENVPGIKAWFTSNHDENSWNGTEYEKYGDAAKALAVHSCTWPGIPLVYSGQELPNRKRLKFFDKDVIEWAEKNELQDFYRTLLELHHNYPALDSRAEVFPLHSSADENIFAYLRKQKESEVVVILNLSPHVVRFDILSGWINGNFKEVFTNVTNDFTHQKSFEMKGWEYMLFRK